MKAWDENLLEKTTLLEECMNAYKYAVEVVQKDSVHMVGLCASCAEVCRTCAADCLNLGDTEESRIYRMCVEYAGLCDQLNSPHEKEKLQKSG